MSDTNDWILGRYYAYNFDDIDGSMFKTLCVIVKNKKKYISYWNYGPDFEYKADVIVSGSCIRIFSRRDNADEYVVSILPVPVDRNIDLLWGVAVGTLRRGNKPAMFKVLMSCYDLSRAALKSEFERAGVIPGNGISVIDYDVENKNYRPGSRKKDFQWLKN